MLIPCQEEQYCYTVIRFIAFRFTLAPLAPTDATTIVRSRAPDSDVQYYSVPTSHTTQLECLAIAGHEHTRLSEMYIVPAVHE